MQYCAYHRVFAAAPGEVVTLEVRKTAGESIAALSDITVSSGPAVTWKFLPATDGVPRWSFEVPASGDATLQFSIAFAYTQPGEAYDVSFPGSGYPGDHIEFPQLVRVYSFAIQGPKSCHCDACGDVNEGAVSGHTCTKCFKGKYVCHRF